MHFFNIQNDIYALLIIIGNSKIGELFFSLNKICYWCLTARIFIWLRNENDHHTFTYRFYIRIDKTLRKMN